MPTYLVESYTQPSRPIASATAKALALAAAELGREGVRIEHRRTTFLVDDETCFYLFDAPCPAAVDELCRRAGLGRVRVVRAVET